MLKWSLSLIHISGEFAKLFVIIFTAWFLSEKPDRIKSVTKGILPLVGIAAVYGLLIVKQPNLSTAITVCGIIVSMMLVAGMKWRYVFGTAALGGACLLYTSIQEKYNKF